MTSLDYTAPLLRIKESGADMVLTTISGAAPGLVCRDAAKIDFPKDVPIITEQAGVGAEAVRKMAGDAISYIIAGQAMYNIEEDKGVPTMKLLREVQEKYHGKLINSADYTGGFHQAMVTVEAIKRAVDKVGLENLNGAAVKEALDTIQNWDGAMTRTVSYGDYDGDRLGAETVRAIRYDTEKQAIVPVSDWFHVPLTLFE